VNSKGLRRPKRPVPGAERFLVAHTRQRRLKHAESSCGATPRHGQRSEGSAWARSGRTRCIRYLSVSARPLLRGSSYDEFSDRFSVCELVWQWGYGTESAASLELRSRHHRVGRGLSAGPELIAGASGQVRLPARSRRPTTFDRKQLIRWLPDRFGSIAARGPRR